MAVVIFKKCNKVAAHTPEVKAELKKVAARIESLAKGRLAEHHHDGDSKITVTRGQKLDMFVNLEDSGGAAAAIEFGHMTPKGRWVDGIHALTGSLSP